jgi:transposase-like protein
VDSRSYPDTAFGCARRVGGRHGYVAYFPADLPRSLDLPSSTLRLLGDAEAALGRLAGAGRLMPATSLLTRPYVLREALSSTRIEGTQATMAEVLEFEAADEPANADVEEVLGYVDALQWGLEQRRKLPMSTRLLRGMHRRLMAGSRDRSRTPGELAESLGVSPQTLRNWRRQDARRAVTGARSCRVPPPRLALPNRELASAWNGRILVSVVSRDRAESARV